VITSSYLRAEDEQIASQLGIRALILKPNTVEEPAEVLGDSSAIAETQVHPRH
jgi:hypothetical protein